jgi:hypothetical protein
MHALMVLPADIQDRDAAPFLLRTATARMPTLQRAMADGGYQGAATAAAVEAEAGIPLEIVKRSDTAKASTFCPSAGLSSAPSVGSVAAGVWPRTSRTSPVPTPPSSSSP